MFAIILTHDPSPMTALGHRLRHLPISHPTPVRPPTGMTMKSFAALSPVAFCRIEITCRCCEFFGCCECQAGPMVITRCLEEPSREPWKGNREPRYAGRWLFWDISAAPSMQSYDYDCFVGWWLTFREQSGIPWAIVQSPWACSPQQSKKTPHIILAMTQKSEYCPTSNGKKSTKIK